HTCPQPRHSAEGEGFEPSVSLPTTVFKTATFGRSVNPPVRRHCCASARPQPNRPGPPARPCRTCSASTGLRRDYSATTPCLLAHPSRAHLYLLWTTDHPPGAYRGPMRAMVITDDAGMTPSDVSEPEAGPDEVVIDVAAAGVNRADLLQLKGLHPPPPGAATWPGLEVSGTISQVGADVTGWSVGDRVAALVDGGGYADRARARAGDLLAVPEHLDLAGAAAFPEALGTLWSNLADVPGLDGPAALLRPHASAAPGSDAPTAAGRTILIHGGSGGVGSVAIQLFSALGARVLTTAGGTARTARCLDLGAAAAIDHRSEDFTQRVRDLTEGRGVDAVLDPIGAAYLDKNISVLAP